MSNFNSIKIQNISKSFDNKLILDSISCEFMNNQVNVILGKSGTGKSVLLKILIGLFEPDSGSLLIDGEELKNSLSKNDITMSYIFQSSALLNSLSVIDNVTIFLDEHNIGTKDDRLSKAYDILTSLGIRDSSDKMPSDLSGGMRKRVAIARSLVVNPDIILYDEPTAELDPINTKIISKIINDLNSEKSITQVVVTHDIGLAYSIADKISILDEGKIVISGDIEEVKKSNNAILNPI
ncbi:ATP-binding cassette domain-containing protein [bacterium]|nr:ATP-binding cassette domain-containing protein [bacterium]MBT3849858.1 ATP-binding cassette domain-containing protein [bacterium]MBT4634305.1 ATP-binding cassette domain-containing protein [bacterium]